MRLFIAIFLSAILLSFTVLSGFSSVVKADETTDETIQVDTTATPTPSPTDSPTPTPSPVPSPSEISENTFSFPSCDSLLSTPGDKAHFSNGTHQIVDGPLLSGSDDVFRLDQGNFLQCFCPTDDGPGIQTDWLRTNDPISGWIFLNGKQWDLGDKNFAAKNSNFSCKPVTPSPTPTSENQTSLELTGVSCDNMNFNATATVRDSDNNPVSGVLVHFTYHGAQLDDTTAADGRATVGFAFVGDESVYVNPEGNYPSQAVVIHGPGANDCSSQSGGGGSVGGSSSGNGSGGSSGSTSGTEMGQFAATGVVEDTIMNVLGLAGAGFTIAGSIAYAKKRA